MVLNLEYAERLLEIHNVTTSLTAYQRYFNCIRFVQRLCHSFIHRYMSLKYIKFNEYVRVCFTLMPSSYHICSIYIFINIYLIQQSNEKIVLNGLITH